MSAWSLTWGDCRTVLPELPAASVDLVLTDPPYPCIKRDYGSWTEAEWFALMRAVVPECMRILKPAGSAVFVLQPNSERDGRLRTWLWEFMLWVGKEWGVVQDAWWFNTCPLPAGNGVHRDVGLLRPALKVCAWVGPPGCYRNQGAVLLPLASASKRCLTDKSGVKRSPSGRAVDSGRMVRTAQERGGSTPMNVLPMGNANHSRGGGKNAGHGARTPLPLCSWWVRYLCPPGGIVLDPFSGSGTVGLAAIEHGASFIGIESVARYHEMARQRLAGCEATV